MGKFEMLECGVKYDIKINKIFNERLKKFFTEGNTYTVETSVKTHNEKYEWTTRFICYNCDIEGFCQIDEFQANIEIVKFYDYYQIQMFGDNQKFDTYGEAEEYCQNNGIAIGYIRRFAIVE